MADCIFCEIVHRRMKSDIVYEDEDLVVFNDINPQAPLHALIVPRKHIESIHDVQPEDAALISNMVLIVKKIAEKYKVTEDGYRLVLNHGINGGQTIPHLHMHILGGRRMIWPPG
jgi:histidine triad (HIT) family protein